MKFSHNQCQSDFCLPAATRERHHTAITNPIAAREKRESIVEGIGEAIIDADGTVRNMEFEEDSFSYNEFDSNESSNININKVTDPSEEFVIRFANDSVHRADIYWDDGSYGVLILTLELGGTQSVNTFLGHKYFVTRHGTKEGLFHGRGEGDTDTDTKVQFDIVTGTLRNNIFYIPEDAVSTSDLCQDRFNICESNCFIEEPRRCIECHTQARVLIHPMPLPTSPAMQLPSSPPLSPQPPQPRRRLRRTTATQPRTRPQRRTRYNYSDNGQTGRERYCEPVLNTNTFGESRDLIITCLTILYLLSYFLVNLYLCSFSRLIKMLQLQTHSVRR